MRNIIYSILAGLLLTLYSCEDFRLGDNFIDQPPEVLGITLDTVFDSELYAMQVLTKAYTFLPYGIPINYNNERSDVLHGDMLESITDMSYSTLSFGGGQRDYYNGAHNAADINKEAKYNYTEEGAWEGIRYAWIFIENVHKVPDMTDAEKASRAAEAKMIVAFHYADMFRHFGGMSWFDHSIGVNEDFNFPRLTVEETVNNIVDLIDEAVPDLEWRVSDDNEHGRMTQAFALGLKLRVLLFAASPIFNDDVPYMEGLASTAKMTWYGNKDKARWDRAKAAGKEFMDALAANGQYNLVSAVAPTEDAYREAFRNAYTQRDNGEVLLSVRNNYKNIYGKQWCSTGTGGIATTQSPTLKFVSTFPMADGSDFPADFDWSNVAVDPYANRDPRFYETIMTHGRPFKGRTSELAIGGLDRDDASKDGTGFIIYKFAQDQTTATSVGIVDSWPTMRLSEVYLSYAEAINESNGGPNTEAYNLVDMVRNRVGLNGLSRTLTQEQFRAAVLKERACELGYEQVHWHDIVRWKDEAAFKSPIQGVNMFIDASQSTGFRYEVFTLKDRNWQVDWNPKWYLSCFPLIEINKNYGLVQNPGW